MTFKNGWLERQLETASKTVDKWSTTKREALALNRAGYSCIQQTSNKTEAADKNR